MTIRHHRILWFLAIYCLSLAGFAGVALLTRMFLRWMVS
jgi:Tfp pilus assembly protein PilN